MKKTKMKFHASCRAFPVLPDNELAALSADIAIHGLRFPILTLNGQIVDGRNRYLACEKAGVEPRYQEIARNDSDPAALVSSLNLLRRHLSTAQRAMIAAELLGGQPAGRPVNKGDKKGSEDPLTIVTAAKLLNVSRGSVKRAKKVKEKGSDALKAAVHAGKTKLPKAARIARLPKKEQAAALARPEPKKPRGGLYADKVAAEAAAQIASEAKEHATREQKKNGVSHEPRGAYVKLTEAVYNRFPASEHKDATTVGEMVQSFLDIAQKVLSWTLPTWGRRRTSADF